MNETVLNPFLERPEMTRADREMHLPSLSRRPMHFDRARPPEPDSFRLSLETMRRSSAKKLRQPSPDGTDRPQAHEHEVSRSVSHHPEEQAPAGQVSGRRQYESEKKDENHRSAEVRKHGTSHRSQERQKPTRAKDAAGAKNRASQDRKPGEQVPSGGTDDAGDPEKEVTAAAITPTGEMLVPAASHTGQNASAGLADKAVSPEGSAALVFSESNADSVKTVLPEETREQGNELTDADSGDAASAKTSRSPALNRASEQSGKGVGKVATSLQTDTATDNLPADMQPKQAAAPSARNAAPDSLTGQTIMQPSPAADSREAALPAKPGGGVAAPLEETSKGRVVKIGSDNQGGQTDLFHGTHSPPGTVQGSSASPATDAPAHPFSHELLQQVTEKTIFFLKNGKSQARIDLKPEFMGNMRLHVSTDNGQVTLKIMTESAWVRDVIEGNINHLKNELQNHNLQIDRLDVSVSGGSQDFADGDSRPANSQRALSGSAPGSGEERVTPSVGGVSRRLPIEGQRPGLVDYFA